MTLIFTGTWNPTVTHYVNSVVYQSIMPHIVYISMSSQPAQLQIIMIVIVYIDWVQQPAQQINIKQYVYIALFYPIHIIYNY